MRFELSSSYFDNYVSEKKHNFIIQNTNNVDFTTLLYFHVKCFPARREAFLREWINMPDSKSSVLFENNEICAFGTIRKCFEGYKIGPLFAKDFEKAQVLFCDFTSYASSEKVCPDSVYSLPRLDL